ncbi:unnamed protein product [Paramecium sonneborni]|uniref:SET domain-containing protein n=1 Tax=Paramecium sonneborni TaxID=65129 RepID=A0A8S1M6A4_9CILI|nr:unnamed protein product [Paramecium sonneborni]
MQSDQTQMNEIDQNQKYEQLLEWGIENGVKMKGVQIPAFFEDVIGVIATEDLPSNSAIICIPQSLIISPNKCKRSNLNQVYNSHPEVFDQEETNDGDFNILIFYIFNEKKKGEQSFYYPYINAIQSKNTLLGWSNDDLQKIEDTIILEEFGIIKQDVLGLWGKAKLIFDNNENVFGESRITDKRDFYWAVECVMSRCFEWAQKSTCLIPIADFLNHSNKACTHYVIHQGFEKGIVQQIDKKNCEQQYIQKRNKIDLSILGIENGNDIQRYEDQKIKYIIENKEYIEDINQIKDLDKKSKNEQREIINQIQQNQLIKDGQLNIWDLDSISSSDNEDNDSDEEIKQEKQKQFEILKIKELAELKLREEQKRIEREYQQINISNQRIVTVTLNPEKKNKVIIRGLPQYQIEAIKAKQQMMNGRLISEGKESIKQNDNQSENSEESKWDWLDEYDQDIYFCIVSTIPIKKFEQVTISYGKRTNRFLLCWYGFALPENVYSSYNFRLWLNTDILQEKNKEQILNTIIIKKLISEDESIIDKISCNGYEIAVSSLSQEFRIKKHKLNMDIIIFLRLLLSIHYNHEKGLLSTIPLSIDFEIFVMQFYDSILNHLLNSYSQDFNQDVKELEQTREIKKRFAIYINKERKEILINQIKIVLEAIIILNKFKQNRKLKENYLMEDFSIVKGLKRYLQLINEFL